MLPILHDPLPRRLAALLLAVTLILVGLVWQIADLRWAMLDLVDQELVAARHAVPTPEQLAAARAQFDGLQSGLAWRLRAAAALGFIGLALTITLVAEAIVRPRRSPVSEAIARLEAALDDARRLALQIGPVISEINDDFRNQVRRR